VQNGVNEFYKKGCQEKNSPLTGKREDFCLEIQPTASCSSFEHRGAAMQEARFVIDEIAPNRKNYEHRLKDYNSDPTTTFADIQKFFRLLEERISERYFSNLNEIRFQN
jgi:hypothetical protein